MKLHVVFVASIVLSLVSSLAAAQEATGAAAAPADAQAAPVAPAATGPSEDAESFPTKLAAGKSGLYQPGMLLQPWLIGETHDSGGKYVSKLGFRFKRLEMHMKGDMVPKKVKYHLMVDVSKLLGTKDQDVDIGGETDKIKIIDPGKDNGILQDTFVTYVTSFAEVSMGQFKSPIGWEGYNNSASKLVFPERAMVVRTFGDRRDVGLRIRQDFEMFSYHVTLQNGSGLNTTDTNLSKNLALRLEAYPVKGAMLAGAVQRTVGTVLKNTLDRYEVDARFERGPILLQAEYIRGHDTLADLVTEGQGYYVLAAYTFAEKLQVAGRFGFVDPDIGTDLYPSKHPDPADTVTAKGDETRAYELGLTYFIAKHEAKLMLAYGYFDFVTAADAMPADAEAYTPSQQLVFQAQVAF